MTSLRHQHLQLKVSTYAALRPKPQRVEGPAQFGAGGISLDVKLLQRSIGNRATERLLRGQTDLPPKMITPFLRIGAKDDPQEREADTIADQVMRGNRPSLTPLPAAPALRRLRNSASRNRGAWGVDRVLRQPGAPLAAEARTFLGDRFGQDFAQVRIHHDHDAAKSAA